MRECIFHASLRKHVHEYVGALTADAQKREPRDQGSLPPPLSLSLFLVDQRLHHGRNLLKVVKDERSCTSLCARGAASPLRFLADHRNFGSVSSFAVVANARRACVHPGT